MGDATDQSFESPNSFVVQGGSFSNIDVRPQDKVYPHSASKTPLDRWNNLKNAVKLRVPQILGQKSGLGHGSGELVEQEFPGIDSLPNRWRSTWRSDENLAEEGVFAFASPQYSVSDDPDSHILLTILRVEGGGAPATLFVKTRDTRRGKAREGQDYLPLNEEIEFSAGEYRKSVKVSIIGNEGYQGSRSFEVYLDNPVGGQLGNQSVATVTILETAVKRYLRFLQSPGFGLLTFLATVFTLVGGNLMLLYLDKTWDTVIGVATLVSLSILCVEMWSLVWLKRLNYLFTTVFFMDLVAIFGLVFFLPWIPPVSFGFLGIGNASIFTVARAARSASSGIELGRNVGAARHVLRAIRRTFRWLWRAVAKFLPGKLKQDLIMEVKIDESDSEDDKEVLDFSEKRSLGEGEEEGKALKGAKEFVGLLLPSTGNIGINIVEFVIGRLILMMMLLLLVVLSVLRAREVSPDVHRGALSLVDQAISENPVQFEFYLKMYAEYVIAQNQKLLYLRIQGKEIGSEIIEKVTCNRSRIYSENLYTVRSWWLQLIVPKAPGINNVTIEGDSGNDQTFNSSSCFLPQRTLNTTLFTCPSMYKDAVHAPLSTCGSLVVVDDSSHQKRLIVANLWITFALVAILGMGAAVIATDVHRLFLKPMENLWAVLLLTLGSRRGKRGAKEGKKKEKDGENGGNGGNDGGDSPGNKCAQVSTINEKIKKKKKKKKKGGKYLSESEDEGNEELLNHTVLDIIEGGQESTVRESPAEISQDLEFLSRLASDLSESEEEITSSEHKKHESVEPKKNSSWRILSQSNHEILVVEEIPPALPMAESLISLEKVPTFKNVDSPLTGVNNTTFLPPNRGKLRRRNFTWRGKRGADNIEILQVSEGFKEKENKEQNGGLEVDYEEKIRADGPDLSGLIGGSKGANKGANEVGEVSEESLFLGLLERISRIVEVDLRSLDRQIDKVERAFGWHLLALREVLRGIVLWITTASTAGSSLAHSFEQGTLTLTELREKIGTLYTQVRLPQWAAQSMELTFLARMTSVFGDAFGEWTKILESQALVFLRQSGIPVESRENLSLNLLTRVAVEVILRYKVLQKMEEEIPDGFEQFRHSDLWNFFTEILRRKLRQHLESSGKVVPPHFMQLPVSQLWPAMGRISTHHHLTKLLQAGLTLPLESGQPKSLRELNRIVSGSLKKSVKKILKSYGVQTKGLELGSDIQTLKNLSIEIQLSQVPAVKEAWEALQFAVETVSSTWPPTMAPLLHCLDMLRGKTSFNEESHELSSEVDLFFQDSLLTERSILLQWGIPEGFGTSTDFKDLEEPLSPPSFLISEATNTNLSLNTEIEEVSEINRGPFSFVGLRKLQFSEIRAYFSWVASESLGRLEDKGIKLAEMGKKAVFVAAMVPLSEEVESVLAEQAGRLFEQAIKLTESWQGSINPQEEEYVNQFLTLISFGKWAEKQLKNKVRKLLWRHGLLRDTWNSQSLKKGQKNLSLDEELRLGLAGRVGPAPSYVRVANSLNSKSTEELEMLLAQIGEKAQVSNEEGGGSEVNGAIRRWMARGLDQRGVPHPVGFQILPLEEASEMAEAALAEKARWHLESHGIPLSAVVVQRKAVHPVESLSLGPYEKLGLEVQSAMCLVVQRTLQNLIQEVAPDFQGGQVRWEWEGPHGALGLDQTVQMATDVMMQRLEFLLESTVDPFSLENEPIVLCNILRWWESVPPFGQQSGIPSPSEASKVLISFLNKAVDLRVPLSEPPGHLELKCLKNLRSQLDAFILQSTLTQMDSKKFTIPQSLQVQLIHSNDSTHFSSVRNLISLLQNSTRNAAQTTFNTLGVDLLSDFEDEEIQERTISVDLISIPEVSKILEAVSSLPPSDGDDIKRFLLSSGYPEKWLPFLPKGTALPPLEDVIDAPKANLGVIVLQVLIQLVLTGQDKKMLSMSEGVGDIGRGIISAIQHLEMLYKERENTVEN